MPRPLALHPDRLLPTDCATRDIAREPYRCVADLPLISPHGHTDPAWFANTASFGNIAELLLVPDLHLFRMLHLQGVSLKALGVGNPAADAREASRLLALQVFN